MNKVRGKPLSNKHVVARIMSVSNMREGSKALSANEVMMPVLK